MAQNTGELNLTEERREEPLEPEHPLQKILDAFGNYCVGSQEAVLDYFGLK